jgi:trk system potassium uptake protein TrkH
MKPVITYLSSIFRLFSIFLLVPAVVAILYGESPLPFILTLLIGLVAGWLLGLRSSLSRDGDLAGVSLSQGLALSALSYISLSMLGMVPFLFSFKGPAGQRLLNSWFEAVSGLTTTGLTMVPDVTALPRSTLLWRSELQWIGGIGVVIVFMFLIYHLRAKQYDLRKSALIAKSSVAIYKAILPEKLEAGIKSTVRRIAVIYGMYTLAGMLLLWWAGLSLFEATNITFTAISTGGFIVTSEFYTTNVHLIVIGSLMIVGATSFIVHDQLFRARIREAFRNLELRLFAALFLLLVCISLLVFPQVKIVLFQVLSALTGTGYSVYPIPLLPTLVIALLVIAMVTGSSLASTCGGLKLFRVYTVLRAILWRTRTLAYPPTAIIPFQIRKKTLPEETLLSTEIFVSSFMVLITFGVVTFMMLGYSFLDSSFQVVSALGTVGLSTIPLFHVPVIGKLVLMVLMLLGRLEVFPFFVLLHKLFGKH